MVPTSWIAQSILLISSFTYLLKIADKEDYSWNITSTCFPSVYITMFYCRPDLIKYDQLLDNPRSYKDNLNNAFEVAEKELGLFKMLDAKGISYSVDATFEHAYLLCIC